LRAETKEDAQFEMKNETTKLKLLQFIIERKIKAT